MRELEKKSAYEARFRHKLNILEPGAILLKWIGLLFVLGLALLLLHLRTAAWVLFGLSGLLFFVLVVLLAIEAYQDKVLYELAVQEDRERDDYS